MTQITNLRKSIFYLQEAIRHDYQNNMDNVVLINALDLLISVNNNDINTTK